MNSINPMFQTANQKAPQTLKRPVVRKKPKTLVEGRKQRKDKKNDIKIPLTEDQRRLIKVMAHKENLYPTHYVSQLISESLSKTFLQHTTKLIYPSQSKLTCSAKLNETDYKILKEISIKWDCSIRKAAFHLLHAMINFYNENEVEIHEWQTK